MIIIKNDKEIDLMRIAGRIVAETLLLVEKEVRPGITTAELDSMGRNLHLKGSMDFLLHYVYLLMSK